MRFWRTITFIFVLVVAIHGTKGDEDDEALVENTDDDVTSTEIEVEVPEVDPVPYVTPDIHPSVYFAEHFDSDESFEKKWIKSSAKKDGVESAIDR